MDKNNKLKSGIKRIILSMTLAFTGPILFVLGSNPKSENHIQILLIVTGGCVMLVAVFFGFTGIQKILSAFFDESNE